MCTRETGITCRNDRAEWTNVESVLRIPFAYWYKNTRRWVGNGASTTQGHTCQDWWGMTWSPSSLSSDHHSVLDVAYMLPSKFRSIHLLRCFQHSIKKGKKLLSSHFKSVTWRWGHAVAVWHVPFLCWPCGSAKEAPYLTERCRGLLVTLDGDVYFPAHFIPTTCIIPTTFSTNKISTSSFSCSERRARDREAAPIRGGRLCVTNIYVETWKTIRLDYVTGGKERSWTVNFQAYFVFAILREHTREGSNQRPHTGDNITYRANMFYSACL
jgi:hypothetical protein